MDVGYAPIEMTRTDPLPHADFTMETEITSDTSVQQNGINIATTDIIHMILTQHIVILMMIDALILTLPTKGI